ncbi:helix-turn-helix transcriptional regulator [Kitasatospora sp. NPDC005751]|uniref:PadR family transcriptional regulator n=1 Tax=Kitasatospora sp. NPDC005751 TaxID=3157064 RepID=UPI0033E21BC1
MLRLDGHSRLSTGTLYTALDRLLQQGLVRIDSEEVVSGRLRRTFALTDQGQDALAQEATRLRAAATEAERRLGAFRPRPQGATS